jgi:uncharacterized protein (DUF924 family)
MTDMVQRAWSDDVLRFWFDELTEEQWWASTPALDETIRQRFGALLRRVEVESIDTLAATPETALVAVIVLDQFSRNLFRRTAEAFASDAKALAIAEMAIARGHDAQLTADQRSFLCMPFVHAEDLAAQARAVELFTTLGKVDNLRAAQEHQAIIQRFGRFPHRNAALGRASTHEEATQPRSPPPS